MKDTKNIKTIADKLWELEMSGSVEELDEYMSSLDVIDLLNAIAYVEHNHHPNNQSLQ